MPGRSTTLDLGSSESRRFTITAGRSRRLAAADSSLSRRTDVFARVFFVSLVATTSGLTGNSLAEVPTARVVTVHGYTQAIELKLGKTRAVLCPQAGGRVLEFPVDGIDAMYLDPAEKNWRPREPGPVT